MTLEQDPVVIHDPPLESPLGVRVERTRTPLPYAGEAMLRARRTLAEALDHRRGALLTSGFEYPGRYARYDLGFVDPPLGVTGDEAGFVLEALNERGRVLLEPCARALAPLAFVGSLCRSDTRLSGRVERDPTRFFPEEERTRQPGLIALVRALREALSIPDPHLGLFGAFGYDLVREFEPLRRRPRRLAAPAEPRVQLYLPDRLLVIDHQRQQAAIHDYELSFEAASTRGLPRATESLPFRARGGLEGIKSDFAPGEFEQLVERALSRFRAGDLFEVTPSQRFTAPCRALPSRVFAQLEQDNPAPYGFLLHLGEQGHLVGASPEMFVRVRGRRVETCPIAGTIARGRDAFGDAQQILALLSSDKDAAELTMCTDVDRNDKARICEPGSVRVLGRRQIELYSRLIHTVDHVEGVLRPEMDALDALVSHGWAVTVTGAPKLDAMQFIEDEERTPRGYYAGAVGVVGLDGSLNTGLTIRTLHLRAGRAEVRAGATLLHASDPAAEAAECQLKASALLSALERAAEASLASAPQSPASAANSRAPARAQKHASAHCVLIDHRDSFVHTLGDYLRQLGLRVTTVRVGVSLAQLDALDPRLVVMSPGPGRPRDFDTAAMLAHLERRGLPMFGVCLGMQALVEYAGGQLSLLPRPHHGSASPLHVLGPADGAGGGLFAALPDGCLTVGRYHSLHTTAARLPACLAPLAESADDGVLMACAHRRLPFMGVQFHPESIMSARDGLGLQLLDNAMGMLLA